MSPKTFAETQKALNIQRKLNSNFIIHALHSMPENQVKSERKKKNVKFFKLLCVSPSK